VACKRSRIWRGWVPLSRARPGAGHLPAESQRHPASGRVLGQVRDLRLGLRRESGGQFRPVYPAGGHRRLERGRWRLLLPTDRGHDVPSTGSPDRRAPRRLAGGSGRGRLCVAVTDSRALPWPHRPGISSCRPGGCLLASRPAAGSRPVGSLSLSLDQDSMGAELIAPASAIILGTAVHV